MKRVTAGSAHMRAHSSRSPRPCGRNRKRADAISGTGIPAVSQAAGLTTTMGCMKTAIGLLLILCSGLQGQTKKVIANLSPEMVNELAKVAPNVRIVPARGADLAREIEDADAMVGVTLTPELFKHAKQLKWLHIASAGVETYGRHIGLFPALVESNVVVTNAK